MPVGTQAKRTFYSVDKDTGKICTKNRATGEVYSYDYISGYLKEIKYRENSEYGDKFAFTFTGKDGKEEEVFQAGGEADYIHTIIAGLDNNPAPNGFIRLVPFIRTYQDKTGVTRDSIAMVAYDETKGFSREAMMRFSDTYLASRPEIKVMKDGSKTFKMKGERVAFMREMAERVSAKYYTKWVELTGLNPAITTQSTPSVSPEMELPDDFDTQDDDLPF